MTDAGFVLAAYGVILGGLALYAWSLGRRVRAARAALHRSTAERPSPEDR